MTVFKKTLYILIGFLTLGLGIVGIFLPILPTTPLLLLCSFCFLKGSAKLDQWFKQTKIYKKHLAKFVEERAMTLKQKIIILIFADTMILVPCILIDNLMMRIVLISIILIKLYYFTFKIKTIQPKSLKVVKK